MNPTADDIKRATDVAHQLEGAGYFAKAKSGDEKGASYFARMVASKTNPSGKATDWGWLSKPSGGFNIEGYADGAIVFGNNPSDLNNVLKIVTQVGSNDPNAIQIGSSVQERRPTDLWVNPVPLPDSIPNYLVGGSSGAMVPWVAYNEQGFNDLKRTLAYDYARRPQGPDYDVSVWAARTFHNAFMGPDKTPLGMTAGIERARKEWCAVLGVPVIPVPPMWQIGDPVSGIKMAKGDPSSPSHGAGFFPGVYQSALGQTAEDYDSIMKQYKDIGSKVSGSPTSRLNYSPVSPTFQNFQAAEDPSGLREFADTGGFSEGDKESIRARDIAPIRSIYSSAQQGLSRQKALQGGYSPNFGAASAKMAREMSDIISKKTTDVNANLAEMVNRNRLSALPALTSFQQNEAGRKQAVEGANTSAANAFSMFNPEEALKYEGFNREGDMSDFNKILESIKGQQSTYGTTPALASTFGNQVLNAANTVNSFPPINSGGFRSSSPSPYGYARPELG